MIGVMIVVNSLMNVNAHVVESVEIVPADASAETMMKRTMIEKPSSSSETPQDVIDVEQMSVSAQNATRSSRKMTLSSASLPHIITIRKSAGRKVSGRWLEMKDRIKQAWNLAERAHKGQTNKDGKTPYIEHIKGVVKILTDDFKVTNEKMVIAAILHDVIEDCDRKYIDEINRDFLPEFGLIMALTNEAKDQTPIHASYEAYIDHLIWFAKRDEPELIYIKLADMIYNVTNDPSVHQKARYRKALPKLIDTIRWFGD